MSQKLVVKKECERCPRVEEHEVSVAVVRKTGFSLDRKVVSCKVEVDGEQIGSYANLCETCREIVSNYVVSIFQKLEKVSAHRKKKPKGEAASDDEAEATE